MKTNTTDHSEWLILAPGITAIYRRAFVRDVKEIELPSGLSNPRIATFAEVAFANRARNLPWGNLPHDGRASRLWHEKKIGYGGLVHDDWFVVAEKLRVGGAGNVPTTLPGSLRRHFRYGANTGEFLKENEGYAVVAEIKSQVTTDYIAISDYEVKVVGADEGGLMICPPDENGVYVIGFIGFCQMCRRPENTSFPQLVKALPRLKFRLHPDWESWTV